MKTDAGVHSHHISQQFNIELEEIKGSMLEMGGLVEKQLADALSALISAANWRVFAMSIPTISRPAGSASSMAGTRLSLTEMDLYLRFFVMGMSDLPFVRILS